MPDVNFDDLSRRVDPSRQSINIDDLTLVGFILEVREEGAVARMVPTQRCDPNGEPLTVIIPRAVIQASGIHEDEDALVKIEYQMEGAAVRLQLSEVQPSDFAGESFSPERMKRILGNAILLIESHEGLKTEE